MDAAASQWLAKQPLVVVLPRLVSIVGPEVRTVRRR
jgi:hypothetical protein